MICIGIRTKPSCVYYTIINNNGDEFEILTTSNLIVPKALDIPERLSFIRNCLFSIIEEYKVTNAGIRTIESLVNPNVERIYIEGVVQELISNSSIEKYFTGKKSKIASILKENVKVITSYIDGDKIFAEIEDWNRYKKEEKESILVAIASSEL